MIAVILAAGFGTRCRPLTNNKPKSLLPLGDGTVIDAQLHWLFACKDIAKIVVVSNQKFYDLFVRWREGSVFRNQINIINDGVAHENSRLGAIGDLAFVFERCPDADDLLVLGSDNLFEDEVTGLVERFKHEKEKFVVVTIHDFRKTLATVQPNEVSMDTNNTLTYFKEKPKQPATSDFVSLLYVLPKTYFVRVTEYLVEGNNPDNAGSFIEWLVKNKYQVRGFRMSGRRFDIGDVASYRATQSHYP